MRVFSIGFILVLMIISFPLLAGDEFCGAHNTAFLGNETLTYKVYYRVANVYFGAGEAVFHTTIEQLNGKSHIGGLDIHPLNAPAQLGDVYGGSRVYWQAAAEEHVNLKHTASRRSDLVA